MENLIDAVWNSNKITENVIRLHSLWLQRQLKLESSYHVSEDVLNDLVQAAVILASSKQPERRIYAYAIAACAFDLFSDELPGLAGTLRVILTRIGNFPAANTSINVINFTRLPTPLALEEARHRGDNSVKIGDGTIVFTDFQRRLWDRISKGQSVATSAPTSAGKSFVLVSYLRKRILARDFKAICYIVPSRALIGQVTDDVGRWRKLDNRTDISIINVPLTKDHVLPEKAVYILTQERLQIILSSHPDFSPELIVCDEAQNIQDGSRGVLLQNVVEEIITRNPAGQIIFSAPNIKNAGVFAQIFDLDKVEIESTTSPTVSQNFLIVNTRSAIKGKVEVQSYVSSKRVKIGEISLTSAMPSIRERLVKVSEKFGSGKASIIYANGPADAESVASGLCELLEDDEHSDGSLADLADLIRSSVHKGYSLADCLQKRVGFHYGRMPALVRKAVESAFADGRLKFLVTTTTLMQGVNFPAANLFICQPKKGRQEELTSADFWNLAGRAGRLGREFQGNIFLVDYDTWKTAHADSSREVRIESFIESSLANSIEEIKACALADVPIYESEGQSDLEASFARLLDDHIKGNLASTLVRFNVSPHEHEKLTDALEVARRRISLPVSVVNASPTVSALRQERLMAYLTKEIVGGGVRRLEELIPRHPRDPDAYRILSEIYRVCHAQLLSLVADRLHLRMAAISLKWMRGEPLPEIIDENHRRNGGLLAKNIRDTLRDIEQDIRFKYLRLISCYINILSYVLKQQNHLDYLESFASLPSYLEVGASDKTMISLMSLGLSRITARLLTEQTIQKDMDARQALEWLKRQKPEQITQSRYIKEDIERALENNTIDLFSRDA